MNDDAPGSSLVPVVRTAAAYLLATYGVVYFGALALVAGGLSGRGAAPRELFALFKKRKPGDPPSPMERVLGFTLGEAGLAAQDRRAREREALGLARRQGGALRVADVMALFGLDRRTADRELTQIASRHGATASAGGLYRFPRTDEGVPPQVRGLGERLRLAERARNDGWVIGVNCFNLVAAVALGTFGLDALGIGHVVVKTLFAWIPLGLSTLLFAVPIWRRFIRAPSATERRRREIRACILDHVLVRGLPYHFPGDEAAVFGDDYERHSAVDVQTELDSLSGDLGAEVAQIGHGVVRYTFPLPSAG